LLDIELIRSDPDAVRLALARRGDRAPIDRVLTLDARRRAIQRQADDLRARRKAVSKQIGQAKPPPPKEQVDEMRGVSGQVKSLEAESRQVEEAIREVLLGIPNLPRDEVPDGADESDNVVVRSIGDIFERSFEAVPHWDLGERLGIIDLAAGARISGSRFYALSGKGARLQRALVSWMLDVHTAEHGYTELYLPYLVGTPTVTGSGHLPKFADTMYHDEQDDLWLIPTAEVPITGMFAGEVLEPGVVPASFVSHTPCFRREKAAAGRDTRGIKRVHQFDKVEMYKFVHPADSDAELETLVADAEDLIQRLGLPYRVLELSTGDLGFSAVRTYDLEMWAPGSGEWLEVSSCSNTGDFQARRAGIRYRPEAGAKLAYPHTLNGSGLALPRVMIAILENGQQPDGSVVIPEVLHPYTGFETIA
jgi:seryl-tRNA synthetase